MKEKLSLALFTLLLFANVTSAVTVAWARHQTRILFVELRRLERERDQLDIEFTKLQLERATLADVGRIERIAREQLRLRPVARDRIEVIGR